MAIARTHPRFFASLLTRFSQILPDTRQRLATLKKEHSAKVIDTMTVNKLIGGMQGVKMMLTDTSRMDPPTGIKIRGLTIQELLRRLPREKKYPLAEGMLFLLLTGEVPSYDDVEELRLELVKRAILPIETIDLIRSLSKDIPSLTQLSIGLLSLQSRSRFAGAYNAGTKKGDYWKSTYEDSLDLIARIPVLAAYIYKTKYRYGPVLAPDYRLDWAANFARMLGFPDPAFYEYMRLYSIIHCEHGGGNVCAHTTNLVSSALSDPYLSFSAGLNGLSGPLHGLAELSFMKWLTGVRAELGDTPSGERLENYVRKTLEAGERIPAYGTSTLRVEDAWFLCQQQFAKIFAGKDPVVQLAERCQKIVPKVMLEMYNIQTLPKLYAYSGPILHHFGLTEYEYFAVLFGVSRSIGCMSQLMWSRGLGMPIERPDSINMDILDAVKLTS